MDRELNTDAPTPNTRPYGLGARGSAAREDVSPPSTRPSSGEPTGKTAMAGGGVTGEHHHGRWTDVGTPQRLAQLDAELKAISSP